MSTTLNGTVNGTYDNYTAELVSPDRARKILSENPSEFKDMRLAMILTTSIREGTWKRDRHVVVYNPDGSIRLGREVLMAIDRAGIPATVFFDTSYDDEDEEDEAQSPARTGPKSGADWAILDDRGVFMELDKSILSVDPSYQRSTAIHIAKTIKRRFCWAAFGVLMVARRPDGSFFVYDGGHRLLAANMIDEINTVPCMVYDMADN